jgi:hypothetical protein
LNQKINDLINSDEFLIVFDYLNQPKEKLPLNEKGKYALNALKKLKKTLKKLLK